MITIREETIGPERAMEMLKLNTGNRNVKPAWVNRLAESMRKGEWKFNGDTIRMNGNRLIDGQHRLHAIVKSGVHLRTLIVDGLDSSVFDTIDIGKTRTGSDTLYALGEKNTTALAATVRIVHNYDEIVKGLATTSFKDSLLDNSALIHRSNRIQIFAEALIGAAEKRTSGRSLRRSRPLCTTSFIGLTRRSRTSSLGACKQVTANTRKTRSYRSGSGSSA